jgi:tetratricopeptide (TPR) repeat protein
MATSALGPKHPDVTYRMSAVAAARANLEQYNEAEEMARSAMKLAIECVELNQATTIYCKLTLAAITGRLGNYREAERIYHEVLEIYRKDQKPNNVGIAWTRSNLATVSTILSQLEEAETLATDAHATLSELGNYMSIYSIWELSRLFILTGRYTKAEGLQLDQLKVSCKERTADETL